VSLEKLLAGQRMTDSDFDETKINRGDDGKFGSGGGSSKGESNKKESGKSKNPFPKSKNGSTQYANSTSMKENIEYAEAEGFDTSDTYTHRTSNKNLEEIKKGERFTGIFTVENGDAGYGEEEYTYVLKEPPLSESELQSSAEDKNEETESFLKKKYGNDLSDDQVDLMISAIGGDFSDTDALSEVTNSIDDGDLYEDLQNLQTEVAVMLGASALRMDDEFGDASVVILPGDGAMNIFRPGVKKDVEE
jgi:hypothetical protein